MYANCDYRRQPYAMPTGTDRGVLDRVRLQTDQSRQHTRRPYDWQRARYASTQGQASGTAKLTVSHVLTNIAAGIIIAAGIVAAFLAFVVVIIGVAALM